MFTLPFRKSRRKSEPSILGNNEANNDNNSLLRINSITSTLSNRSRMGKSRRKSHSHILSRKLSFFNNSSDELNSIAASHDEDALNETVELARFKSLNYDKFNKELLQYLKFQGLSAPRILSDSNYIRISMSSAGENVFLPSIVKFNEEDADNLELDNNGDVRDSGRNSSVTADINDVNRGSITLEEERPRRASRDDEDGHEPVTHTFAVIITLTRPTSVSALTAQLQANTKILWPDGVPSDRSIKCEIFEMGQLSWDLNLSNYNYYVPYSIENEEALEEECHNIWKMDTNIDTEKFITEAKIHPKIYREKSIDQIIRAPYNNYKRDSDPFVIGSLSKPGSVSYPPGDYVFTLPVLFPPLIAESIITQHALVSYNLRVIVAQKNKVYSMGEHPINVLRGPPSTAVSTANKPVYVNKIWNDALNYEISFPKKYVTVGTNIPIKMKFAPLTKDIAIRRIKVSVLEKATYCSKNLNFEYDEASVMRIEEGQRKTSLNERIIPVLEIRTKARTELALREEILLGLLKEDNLLSSCYHSETSIRDDSEIIGQLQIQAYLPFIKPNRANKELKAHSGLSNLIYHNEQRGKSQIDKQLHTKFYNQGFKVDSSTYFNETASGGLDGRGIYPDSGNNRFVQVHHKLQIAIRLSKKDNLGKVHHYEVMIDTPFFFLNSSCIPSNVDLPPYNMAMTNSLSYNGEAISNSDLSSGQPLAFFGDDNDEQLPSFEEAISPMNSPSLQPYQGSGEETVSLLSRTSTLGSSGPYRKQSIDWNYDNIDQLVTGTSELQIIDEPQLQRRRSAAATDLINNLKRTATHNSSMNPTNRSADGGLNRYSTNGDDIQEFSELSNGQAPPPKYTESMPISTFRRESDSSIESLSSVDDDDDDDDDGTNNDSTDLTDQFHPSLYDPVC